MRRLLKMSFGPLGPGRRHEKNPSCLPEAIGSHARDEGHLGHLQLPESLVDLISETQDDILEPPERSHRTHDRRSLPAESVPRDRGGDLGVRTSPSAVAGPVSRPAAAEVPTRSCCPPCRWRSRTTRSYC